jgi:hypothetical protein
MPFLVSESFTRLNHVALCVLWNFRTVLFSSEINNTLQLEKYNIITSYIYYDSTELIKTRKVKAVPVTGRGGP